MINKAGENLTGWSSREAIGQPLKSVFNIAIDLAAQARAQKSGYRNEAHSILLSMPENATLRSRDGTEHVIEQVASPIRDSKNEVAGVVLVFRDITERQRNEAERRKAETLEQLGLLAGGIAHDFNNLLTAIIGNISLASLLLPPDDEMATRLNDAKNASLRARDLAQQLLTFARGGAPIKKTASIGKLIQDTVSFSLRGTHSRSEFLFGADLWPAEIDPGQISQVVANLVVNADQAMPNGGTLRVSCDNFTYRSDTTPAVPDLLPGDYIRIAIRDEGMGIPENCLKRIFDPYFTTKPKGNGLGLATTYSIIKNHNGLICVESQVHYGSTFTLYLPASRHQEMPVEPPRQLNQVISGTGRILIVDDEEAIRALVEFTLERLGYQVTQAESALEGVEIYRQKLEAGRTFRRGHSRSHASGRDGRKRGVEKVDRDRSDGERDRLQRLRDGCHDEPLSGFWLPRRDREALRSGRARQDRARSDRLQPRQSGGRLPDAGGGVGPSRRSRSARRSAKTEFLLRCRGATLVFRHARSPARGLRFEDRRQRHFHPPGCGDELDAQEFALADADGSRLLRHRADGDWGFPFRYLPLRRGSDAVLAAAVRCHDRGRDGHLQNGAGREADLRADARTEMGDRDGRVRFERRNVPVLRSFAGHRSIAAGGRLYFGMSAPAGSVARRFDEVAVEDFGREFIPGTEARVGRATRSRHGMTGPELLASLGQLLGGKIQEKTEFRGETTFTLLASDLREVAKFCKDELSFDYLIDITSVDNFGEEPRFEIVYELYSMTLAVHLRLKLRVSEDEGEVATVSDIWPTANWHEREIYDMMGLRFSGHPDLRRILMWDGYPYFPLRKEFPVEGLPSDMPDVAFSSAAPLEGGPFVTVPKHRDDERSRAARATAGGRVGATAPSC